MLFVSCVSRHAVASVHCCIVVTCWESADLFAIVGDVYCIFVTFSCGIQGQVLYLIVSFPDLCLHSYYAHKTYMEDVVSSDMKQNPKMFWSFIKSKKQHSLGVSSLIDKDGFLHSKGPRKAEFLNEKFHAAYARDDILHHQIKGRVHTQP